MRQRIEHIRRYFAGTPRVFAAALCILALSMSLFSMVMGVNVVTVVDEGGGEHVLLTRSDEPEAILDMAGLVATGRDEVEYTAHSENTASIVIRRAFPVELAFDGEVYATEFVEGTVADLMAEADVILQGEDYVVPELGTALASGMRVEIYRVHYEEEEMRGEVPDDLVEAYVAGLAEDEEFTYANAGGIYNVVYSHRFVNGERESSTVSALWPVVTPRDAGSTAFVNGVPCSTITEFEGVTIGPDGVPTEYSWLMEGAITTAYSSSGGRGASGLGLYTGTVAVNPNVIPYGTRLYITSADNSFVYGYAIATDTGGAMMDGRVDIDLYFATNEECLRFGKRALNVYILD